MSRETTVEKGRNKEKSIYSHNGERKEEKRLRQAGVGYVYE